MKLQVLTIFLLLALIVYAQSDNDHVQQGNNFYRQSQFALAEAQYREAIRINPNNQTAKHNLGNALMQQKKYKEANAVYSEVTASAENDLKAVAHYNNGVAYTKQKDLENSIEAYKNALRINPADREARENLQKALSELRNQNQSSSSNNNKSSMNESEAERKLKQLEQKEQQAQRRVRKSNQGSSGGKDW